MILARTAKVHSLVSSQTAHSVYTLQLSLNFNTYSNAKEILLKFDSTILTCSVLLWQPHPQTILETQLPASDSRLA
jgi:hypothetical protein